MNDHRDMKRDMKRALDDALSGLHENPYLYERLETRLTKEAPTVKRKLSVSVILILVLALLGTAAVAAGVGYGLEWWFRNRSMMPDLDPEKYAAVMNALQTDIPQQPLDETSPVKLVVREASWLGERSYATIVFNVSAADPAVEVHGLAEMDVDGAYVDDPIEEEERSEHYLWTSKGFGPVYEMMTDPSKPLLLWEIREIDFAGMRILGNYDVTTNPDGIGVCTYEFSLDWTDPRYDEGQLARAEEYAHSELPGAWEAAQSLREHAAQAKTARETLRQSLEEGTPLPCSVTYRVVRYQEGDDFALYTGGRTYTVNFSLRVDGDGAQDTAP